VFSETIKPQRQSVHASSPAGDAILSRRFVQVPAARRAKLSRLQPSGPTFLLSRQGVPELGLMHWPSHLHLYSSL
jgi:hypothetical protein